MKTMNCKELGGACEIAFHADSFEEIAEMSKSHAMEMFEKNDAAHLQAMQDMQKLMLEPEAMNNWFTKKRNEFDALAEDQ